MLSRKEHNTQGITLPDEWTQKVTDLLNSVYYAECKEYNKRFHAFGQVFEDELLLIVSFANNADATSLPVTCFLSLDLSQNAKPTKEIDNLLDISGMIFDSVFSDKSWSDYDELWSEHSHKGITFFYKTSRENISMTLLADEILKEDEDKPKTH